MEGLRKHLHTNLNGFLPPEYIEDILLNNIELLSTSVDVALINILKDPVLKVVAREKLDSLKEQGQNILERLSMYESVTSKTMLRLIQDLKDELNGKNLKEMLTKALLTIKIENKNIISMIIYRNIYNFIGMFLEPKRTNTSIVFQSAKNAERSEFIEDLGLNSYGQIIYNFTDLTIHNKNSASPTIVFSGILKTDSARRLNAVRAESLLNVPRLFFKVELADVFSGFAIVEQAMYIELFKLVKYNITPHILCKVATAEFLPEFYHTMINVSAEFKTELEKQMNKANLFLGRDTAWNKTRLIVTQKGEEELHTIVKEVVDLDRLKRILFQLFYTLYVFENIECNHGDLHFGNVFVNKLPEVKTYCYKVNKVLYKIHTDETVKIFDFDCSKIFKRTELIVNTHKKMAKEGIRLVRNTRNQIGITNVYNKNMDKVKALLNLIFSESLQPLIQEIMPGIKKYETVRKTYNRLLFDDEHQEHNRLEASRIFGVEISKPSDIDECGIDQSILDTSWKRYFELISIYEMKNFIIKSSKLETNSQNHLWIPDEIVLTNEQILEKLSLKLEEEDINVLVNPVYTLDDRL
jgi:hypothetical protein